MRSVHVENDIKSFKKTRWLFLYGKWYNRCQFVLYLNTVAFTFLEKESVPQARFSVLYFVPLKAACHATVTIFWYKKVDGVPRGKVVKVKHNFYYAKTNAIAKGENYADFIPRASVLDIKRHLRVSSRKFLVPRFERRLIFFNKKTSRFRCFLAILTCNQPKLMLISLYNTHLDVVLTEWSGQNLDLLLENTITDCWRDAAWFFVWWKFEICSYFTPTHK